MRELKIPMNKYIYNGLIRVYGGAFEMQNVGEDLREMYLKDAWTLFENMQAIDRIPVNTVVLNSLLYTHCKAVDIERINVRSKCRKYYLF